MHDIIAYTSAIIGLMLIIISIKNFQCKHIWIVTHHHCTESKMQHLAQLTNRISVEGKCNTSEMVSRKTITILACQKCGKLNKTITEN